MPVEAEKNNEKHISGQLARIEPGVITTQLRRLVRVISLWNQLT
jgi:hypothetical protein